MFRIKFGVSLKREAKGQRGFTLLEVLIGLAILGIVATPFLGSLTTNHKAVFTADEMATARNLAESQMEYVKQQSYTAAYTASATISAAYPGYSTVIGVATPASRDPSIQEITVQVYHQGDMVQTLEGYKVLP